MLTETQRIVNLPISRLAPWAEDLRRHPRAPPLRPAQAEALGALAQAVAAGPGPWGPRGMAGLIGCGHGKTLIAQLAPLFTGARRPLLLLPAALQAQLDRDIAEWSRHYPLADPPRLTYERLSGPQSQYVLESTRPDLLILDEAHCLANPQSARWRRVSRYLRAHSNTRVVVLSGTLSWAAVGQMRHLLLAALRAWCPLPADDTIEHWGAVLDVGGEPSPDSWRVVRPLLDWAGEGGRGKVPARQAFRSRLQHTPGVVLTPGVAADVSLRMRRWVPRCTPSSALLDAQEALEERWDLPDGTQIVDALEYARHARTLALGFYLRWRPDTVDPDWVEARRRWGGVFRRLVQYGYYDSPALAERAAREGVLPGREQAAWRGWEPCRDREPPETEAVWVDRGWPLAVVREYLWVAGGEEALIWVQSRALGRALEYVGAPYHGQGSEIPTGGSAVVSIGVHSTGKNLQRYHHQLVLEPPQGAARWEQLLARTHREGQVHDVHAWILQGSPSARQALQVGLAGARYVADSQGLPQRLLLADWED